MFTMAVPANSEVVVQGQPTKQTGAVRSFKVPTSDIRAAGGDAFAVVVQAGTKEAPAGMLGAAVASLH